MLITDFNWKNKKRRAKEQQRKGNSREMRKKKTSKERFTDVLGLEPSKYPLMAAPSLL